MEYYRSRFEKIQNEDGSVKEIFIAVKLTIGSDIWEQGYWLTAVERDAVVADEQSLLPIVDRVAQAGSEALANYQASLLSTDELN